MTTSENAFAISPLDLVRAQLGRQKWAVDTRDLDALDGIYARDCVLVLKQGGITEIGRVQGKAEIIAFMKRGWDANPDFKIGDMVHHIGTELIEPTPDGRIRCRTYALYVHLEGGKTELHGYGKYHDYWTLEGSEWRLAEREVHLFGLELPSR